MSSPPPTKPPRGVKQGKETSGLLMSVIRTLSASETNEQRDREKAKLEKEYKKSDQRLDELVSVQADQLTQVMQVFSASCGAVNTCRARLRGARARLSACRGLLRVRRDELRRLWADARQHKYALDMLTQIERLVAVDKEISMHLSQGHYLNAASVLQSALQLSNTNLAQVDALQHLRIELQNKKQSLVERTIIALCTAVYRTEAGLRRAGSGRDRTQASDLPLILAELTRSEHSTDDSLVDINTELELSLTEEDKSPRLQMAILVESLAVLNEVKHSTEKLKVQMQTELLEVIATLSQQVIDFGTSQLPTTQDAPDVTPNQESDVQSQPLVELLTCLLESCKVMAQRQQLMLDIWKQCISKHKTSVQLYNMQHYWSCIQAVLQLLLTDYLDIQNLTLNTQRAVYAAPAASTDINVYFTKKKALTKKKVHLFKFAQCDGADYKSVPGETAKATEATPVRGNSYQLVCPPKPDNLIHIYHILESFMHEIELDTGVEECSLRAFISDHIRTAETERLGAEAKAIVDAATTAPGAWRQVQRAPTDALGTALGEPARAMIFSCAVLAWTATSRAILFGARLGAGAGAVSAPLVALVSAARAAHRHQLAVGGGNSGGGGAARSAKWTADEDIVRFLKSLPNWHNLKYAPSPKKRGPSLNHVMDQDMKQSFEREAEILGSSLGDGTVTYKEIISNNNILRDIAVMCETMDWIATCIRGIPASLVDSGRVLTEAALSELAAAAVQLEELSDNCLLLLHLELRIQCFHYLGQEDTPSSVGGNGSTLAAESGAVRLAGAVRTFHEDALAILQPAKMNYIMQGVGEMMSAGVVSRCQAGAGGAAAQAQRLAALRHCLAAVGLPGDGLHRAAHYLDVLTMTPEEILSMVEEKGPQFSELEYLNAFNLIGKSKNMSDGEMKLYLNKLSNILGNVGVTV